MIDNERVLIQKSQAGCKQSRELLLSQYRPMVVKYSQGNDDFVTIGLLALDKAVSQYDESRECPFSRFVSSRIRGDIANARRKLNRSSGDVSEEREECEPSHNPTNRFLDRLFWRETLHKALTRPEERIVRLAIWDELSTEEISEQLGISESQVWVVYQRALNKLKKYVEELD